MKLEFFVIKKITLNERNENIYTYIIKHRLVLRQIYFLIYLKKYLLLKNC